MKENTNPTSHGRDEDDSWANETLPMGVRRELLDREIQRYSPHHASRGQSSSSHGSDSMSANAEHPRANGDADRPD
jgi:hypothetical protein